MADKTEQSSLSADKEAIEAAPEEATLPTSASTLAPTLMPEPTPEPMPEPMPEPKNDTMPEPKPVSKPEKTSDPTTLSFDELEIFTEQFENYLVIAQAIMKTLKRPKDIEIFSNLLLKVQTLNRSKQLKVKRNNNFFFRYFLKVLKRTSDKQPLELYHNLYGNTESDTESRSWLENNSSYIALKFFQDGTNIVYAAVAEDPAAGWQDGGLSILAKQRTRLEN